MDIKHHFSAGVYARQMSLKKGQEAITHAHKYDHMSILATGRVLVGLNGVVSEYSAGDVVHIKAGANHGIVALEDTVWFCVHATDETDADKMDRVLIK